MFNLDLSGITNLQDRLTQARAMLPQLMQDAVMQAGDAMVSDLSNAAPRGKDGGPPPPGDGEGALADSFYVQQEPPPSASGAAISVRTLQPQKLEYVTQGTGIYGPRGNPILPVNKKALYWPSADHPVRSVKGQQANDFVSGIVDSAPDNVAVLDDVIAQLQAMLGA